MHKLLERQIRRSLGSAGEVPASFLEAIDSAYAQADEDRRLLERSIELTSEELLERNEALSRSLSLLQATLEATEDGILVVDRNRRIESYNQRFIAVWNHPRDILEQRDGRASIEHAATQVVDPEGFLRRLEELYEEPERVAVDEIELRNGRLFERFTRPMRHGDEILGRVWSFRDITDKRQLEEQIRQSQKMEAIGQLAGGIAHDFNNLLTVITGSCGLGLRQAEDHPALRHLLGEIRGAARRASELTGQLLSFSRQGVLTPEALDVDEAIQDVSGMLHRLIRENITLTTHLEGDGARILADRGRFHQIVLNLVINASDALGGGGEIEIRTHLARPENGDGSNERQLVLSVRDNGPGIAPEIQPRIFEPFFTTKPAGEGTGLGLATVYGIVDQFGGTLTFDSGPDRGTEFRIAFPLTDRRQPAVEEPVEEPAIEGATILAVEDNPAVRLILSEMLELLEDCDVHVAAAPKEALERWSEQGAPDLDLLISDIVMPEMNGFELAAELVERYPDLRVLFVSGYDPTSSKLSIFDERQAAAFLSKPFDWETLQAKIRQALADEPYRPAGHVAIAQAES